MAKSKTDKSRQNKVNQFKNKQKSMSQQTQDIAKAKTEKRYIVPQPSWQSTDDMELKGDLLEALEHTIAENYDKLQSLVESQNKVIGVLQQLIGRNVKAGKIKLEYIWNNGEATTEAEATEFKKQHEELLARRKQEMEDGQKNDIAMANAEKTGLVSPDGSPLGSTTPLEDIDAKVDEYDTNR